MRGKDARSKSAHNSAGITPAYAGKSYTEYMNMMNEKDHPRVCGEKGVWNADLARIEGSPPHMRGKALIK